jgi:hypothetical protein
MVNIPTKDSEEITATPNPIWVSVSIEASQEKKINHLFCSLQRSIYFGWAAQGLLPHQNHSLMSPQINVGQSLSQYFISDTMASVAMPKMCGKMAQPIHSSTNISLSQLVTAMVFRLRVQLRLAKLTTLTITKNNSMTTRIRLPVECGRRSWIFESTSLLSPYSSPSAGFG